MELAEYIPLFIAIAYFIVSMTYLPVIIFQFANESKNTTSDKIYDKVRYIILLIMYFIISLLYLSEWYVHSHGEHGSSHGSH